MGRIISKVVLMMLSSILYGLGGLSAVLAASSLSIQGSATVPQNTQAPYTAYVNGSEVTASWSVSSTQYASIGATTGILTASTVGSNQTVTIRAMSNRRGLVYSASKTITVVTSGTTGGKSINSTSQNRATQPSAPVTEQPLTKLSGFNIFSVNDLGMHCGDLDHRLASILPPFNTLHAQVVQKGTSTASPRILTSADVDVVYSAASNPNDPALLNPTATPIFKTNFWDPSPLKPTTSIAFDCYDPFYPAGVLGSFPLLEGYGTPGYG